ncbi:MAG: hypothetical protein ACYDB2_00505 [Acidimicrobiales bacterium]
MQPNHSKTPGSTSAAVANFSRGDVAIEGYGTVTVVNGVNGAASTTATSLASSTNLLTTMNPKTGNVASLTVNGAHLDPQGRSTLVTRNNERDATGKPFHWSVRYGDIALTGRR